MRIRRFKKDDVDELIELFHNTVHTVNARDYEPTQLEAWAPPNPDRARWLEALSTTTTLVCEWNGKLTGFANMASDGYIDRVYTHKAYQGRGVASLLLQELESIARQRGLKVLYLVASVTARPFFARRGFDVVQSRQKRIGNVRFQVFDMRKHITSDARDRHTAQ